MHNDARQLVEHFFRHEYGRIVSLLTHSLGIRQLDLAEDVVQSALSKALITWGRKGVPDNPSGWLYRTARNLAIDALRRDELARSSVESHGQLLLSDSPSEPITEVIDDEVGDETLRLLFLCSNPSIPLESRIALALKTVGGFSIDEIASALLVSRDSAEKRITRAKSTLKEIGLEIADLTTQAMHQRVEAVESTIYLIFSEGYATSSGDRSIRQDLCDEAIRLAYMLNRWLSRFVDQTTDLESTVYTDLTNTNRPDHRQNNTQSTDDSNSSTADARSPTSAALIALMLFHSARLDTRIDESGCDVLLAEQNRSKWNWDKIHEAMQWMRLSASGNVLSRYHIEAAIAWEHCRTVDFHTMDWARVVSLYSLLEQITPGPMTKLNRAIAVSYSDSPATGLSLLEKIPAADRKRLRPWWDCAIADVYTRLSKPTEALSHLYDALALANTLPQKASIERKIAALKQTHPTPPFSERP